MPRKNQVSVKSEPTKYRLSSSERRAAHLAEIAGKQGDLKREAAERRAERARADDAPSDPPAAPVDDSTTAGRSNSH